MKAVVKMSAEKENVQLLDVDMPTISPNEVLIMTKAAPIGSDVRVFYSDPVMMRVTCPPITLGSENAGEIVEIGSEVVGWKPGDRVVAELVYESCERCNQCMSGRPFMCPDVVTLGRGRNGAFAEFFAAPAKFLHRIPENVNFENAAMAEDLGVVIAAIDDNNIIQLADSVAILGPGPIGLLSLQVVKSSGAGHVIISGVSVDKKRLDIANSLGANEAINADKIDLQTVVMDHTHGQGVDVVILASGSAQAIKQSFSIIKKYGTLVVIGFPPGPVEIPWHEIAAKALRVVGSWGASNHKVWEKALLAIAKRLVNVEPLITNKYPLEKWQEAFQTFESCEGVKVELIPDSKL